MKRDATIGPADQAGGRHLSGNHCPIIELMKHVIYAMQFRGTATPGGESGTLKVTTSATSCSIRSIAGPDGVEGAFQPAEGGMAFFESEVRMTGADTFAETGSVSFGEGDNSLNFSTIGQGHLDSKTMTGTVMWKIDSGEGQFAGATGNITSNFFLSADGAVTDYHFGVIYAK